MAGIAFDIQKLLGKRTIGSVLAAFFYSGIVSSGHWLFSVFSLGVLSSMGKTIVGEATVNLFMGLVIYVFAFSMILTNGSQVVITRSLADVLFHQEDRKVPSLLVSCLLLLGGASGILYVPYILFLDLEMGEKIQTIFLFLLVTSMGGAMIFVSTLRAYIQITFAFFLGFSVAVPVSLWIGKYYGLTGFLFGMNCGIMIIVFLLCARVLVEFNGPIRIDWSLVTAHRKFPLLFLYGVFTGVGIWVDKIIFWFTQKEKIGAGLVGYPYYDGAMFIGYLTVLPSLAYFILISETNLYENVRKYMYFLNHHGSLKALEGMRLKSISSLKEGFFKIGLFQGLFTILCVILAPVIIDLLKMSPLQISILRIGMLGAFFQMGVMLLSIVLTYYNGQKEIFWASFLFCLFNAVFTIFSVSHFWFHGYGFFFASFVSFLFVTKLLYDKMKNMHYAMACSN